MKKELLAHTRRVSVKVVPAAATGTATLEQASGSVFY